MHKVCHLHVAVFLRHVHFLFEFLITLQQWRYLGCFKCTLSILGI